MNLIVLTPDADLQPVLVTTLTGAGHEVKTARHGADLLGKYATSAPQVVLLDLDLHDTDALELASQLRRNDDAAGRVDPGDRPYFIGFAREPDGVPRDRRTQLGFVGVLAKPVSILDVADLLGGLGGRGNGAEATAPTLPVDGANLAALSRWWADEVSGVVQVAPPGATPRWATLCRGGPVDRESLAILVDALRGGELTFSANVVEGEGDRHMLGREIWEATRASVAGGKGPNPALGLSPTPYARHLRQLGVSPRLRRALEELRGRPFPLSLMAEHAGIRLDDALPEVRALIALRLFRTTTVATAPPAPRSIPPSAFTGPKEPPPADTPFGAEPTAPPRGAQPSPWRTEPTDVGVTPAVPVKPTALPPRRPVPIAPPRTLPLPLPARGGQPTAPAGPAAANYARILRNEVARTADADPWTILGLPRRSPPKAVHDAHERLTARYQRFVEDANAGIREDAREMLARVDAARAQIEGNHLSQEPSFDDLLRAGRHKLDLEQWAEAEQRLAAAVKLNPLAPQALAWLAWAKVQNPATSEEGKAEAIEASLGLALEVAPAHPTVRLVAARVASLRGDDSAARTHAAALLRLQPTNPEVIELALRHNIAIRTGDEE